MFHEDQNPSAQALNVYGLLLERQGLLQMSVKSLSRCVYLAQQEIDGASVNDVKDLDAYRSNLARVLCSIGDTDSSSKAIQQIQLISEPSRENKSVEALAYVKQAKLAKADPYDNKTPAAELYQSAFSTYSALLEMTTDLEMKSHVYAAMGMLAVKCGDTETAKTAFFQCSESESPSIYGLAGLCSLALLSGDGELAVAALNELIKCGESKEAIKLKAVFNSYLSALDGDMRSARNHLLKAIHCYPSDSDLHDQLIALSIGSLQSNRESILRLSQSVTDVQDLVGLSSLAAGHIQEGLKWAQNAVHLYPDQSKNWMLLLNACYSAEKLSTRNITSKTINTLLNYSEIIADRLNPKQKVWLSEMVLCYTAEYDPQNFTNVLNKHVEFLDGSTLVESLNAFLSKQEISNPADMLSILLNAKLKSSNSPETVNLLKEAVGIKPGIGVMIAKALLDMSMEKRSETKTEFFSSLEGLETSPSAKLLSALYHWFISKNKRLAVKNFRTVMDLLNGRDSYESSIASNFVHHWDTEKQKKEETDK